MKDYKTENLLIMTCSLDMAKSIVLFRKELTVRSPIHIPDKWPSNRFRSFLPLLIEDLENKTKSTFNMWILAELLHKKMIGDILLYTATTNHKAAFLELYFLSTKDEHKYYKEILVIFLENVMTQFAGRFKQVNVEVLYTDNFKMEILKRVGFYLRKRDHPYLLWSYSLPVNEGV